MHVLKKNPVWNFDATGSVIVLISGQKKPLLYSLVMHDTDQHKILPVAEFVTTLHDAENISEYLKCKYP
jgi:hypothetical protein